MIGKHLGIQLSREANLTIDNQVMRQTESDFWFQVASTLRNPVGALVWEGTLYRIRGEIWNGERGPRDR